MTDNDDYVMGLKLLVKFSKNKLGTQFKDIIRTSSNKRVSSSGKPPLAKTTPRKCMTSREVNSVD